MAESPAGSTSSSEKMLEVRYEFTPALPEILSHLRSSLMITTYQAGKLLALGVHDGQLKISVTSYDQPMGIAVDGDRLALGSRRQINFFRGNRDVAPTVDPAGVWDMCYVPGCSSWTGSLHGHDLAWGRDGLWVVNTLFSCLSTLHEDYSFVPRWKPPFVSQIIDQDRCHLNGLALVDGHPRFVTAMAETDTPAGWRPTKATSGVIIDIESGETVSRGFAMPHSPRWHDGRLWVLDSGRGSLGLVDPASGRFEVVETFPGYTRGLSFLGQFAFVGLSRIRETSVFGGVPIAEHRNDLKCGVGVVDLRSGRTVAVFQFLSGVTEIFAVEAVAGVSCPMIAGAGSDGPDKDVWIVPAPGFVPRVERRYPWFHSSRPANTAMFRNSSGNDRVPPPAGQSVEAGMVSIDEWLKGHPDDAAGWVTMGNFLQDQNRQDEAVTCYERAVTADASMSAARQNLGYLLFNLGFPERAREVYRELLHLDPSPMNRVLAASVLPVVYDSADHLRQWSAEQSQAFRQIADDGTVVDASVNMVPTSFFWSYQGRDVSSVMRDRGRILRGRRVTGPRSETVPLGSRTAKRLRVGFLSAWFRNHTIGRLNIGRIEQLNRDRFEVVICSASAGSDQYVERFRNAADSFVTVPRNVPAALQTLESLKLDLLFFAEVGMDALCSTLAYSRVAPVQCATWGHPETSGSPEMDYFLSSELLERPDADQYYTEKLVRMPLLGTYYERPAVPENTAMIRELCGMTSDCHYYACPQSLFKFHPQDDDVFRGILEADPAGVLLIIEGRHPEWTRRLQTRWQNTLGHVLHRVRFLPALSHDNFLRLLRECDVVLDPLHFGGGNSSYEALAMNTPVITLPGRFLRSRITSALYQRMQLSDCVVATEEDYVQVAVRLGTDRDARRRVQSKISERSSVLFRNPDEVRCFEEALTEMAGHSSHC